MTRRRPGDRSGATFATHDSGREFAYTFRMRSLYVLVPLLALLGAALWFAAYSWVHLGAISPDIPLWGWLAVAGGVLFSLALGGGLMALMFYSSRHGYDDSADGRRD